MGSPACTQNQACKSQLLAFSGAHEALGMPSLTDAADEPYLPTPHAGMSGKNMEKVVEWFSSPHNQNLIDRLAQAGIVCVEGAPATALPPSSSGASGAASNAGGAVGYEQAATVLGGAADGPFAGQTIVITGKNMYTLRNVQT